MSVLTDAIAGLARAGATRSGYPIAEGLVLPKYALSGVARSGATRSNWHSRKPYISIAGVNYGQPRVDGQPGVMALSLSDVLNETPTTGRLVTDRVAQIMGQEVIVTLGSINNLQREFGGFVLMPDVSFVGKPSNFRSSASIIDYTWGMNQRKVTGYFTGSATTIIQTLLSTYAPNYTYRAVEAGMPTVDGGITFTNEDLTDCLTRTMKRVGGHWRCGHNRDVQAFMTAAPGTQPTVLNAVHWSLLRFVVDRDLSQVVTRVFVEGGGANCFAPLVAGDTILPIDGDSRWYLTAGGIVVCGPQRITYTGVRAGGAGGLVGPGASPSGVPVLALVSGAGLSDGLRSYAITFVTAAGESIASPLANITVGALAAPTSGPTAGSPTIGTGPNPGPHDYAVSFVTASGETTPGPLTTQTTTLTPAPSTAPTPDAPTFGAGVDVGPHDYAVTFVTAIGETTPSPVSGSVTVPADRPLADPGGTFTATVGSGSVSTHYPLNPGDTVQFAVARRDASGGETNYTASNVVVFGSGARIDTSLTGQTSEAAAYSYRVYIAVNGSWVGYRSGFGLSGGEVSNGTSNLTAGSPVGSNTSNVNQGQISLSAIPLGDANVTSRKLYRRSGGAGLKLLATIADNTTPTYSDTTPNASLGAAVPSVSTAYLQRIALSAIPIGGALVTQRNLWRTAAGGSQLKLLGNLPNNTATTFDDTVIDASLGANAPTSNTAAANRVALSSIPIGAATVTARKIYRTVAGGSQLKLLTTIADNTTPTYADSTADGSLGANVPTSDTSSLAQPAGQVLPGAVTLICTNIGAFSSAGGFAVIGNGQQVIRYTGVSTSSLTGIPSTGNGAITAPVNYGSTVTDAACLTGVPASGAGAILYSILKGDLVNIVIQVDDVARQAALAALLTTPTVVHDGIIEDYITDGRLAAPECLARGQARLDQVGDPLITVMAQTRDINTRSGVLLPVNLGVPFNLFGVSFLIQKVDVAFDPSQPALGPLYSATASTSLFTFEDLLRQSQERVPQ